MGNGIFVEATKVAPFAAGDWGRWAPYLLLPFVYVVSILSPILASISLAAGA